MKNNLYLLNMQIRGVKNIEEPVSLEFYKKTVDRNFEPNKYRIKAIYGENGAGKSALITSVQILKRLISDRRYLNDSKNQQFLSGIINKRTQTMELQCEVLFRNETQFFVMRYKVGVRPNSEKIYEIYKEQLSCKNGNYMNNSYKIIYDIQGGNIQTLSMSKKNRDFYEKKTMNLLTSQTFISNFLPVYAGEESDEENSFVFIVAMYTFAGILNVYMDEEDQHTLYMVQKYLETLDKSHKIGSIMESLNSHINNFVSISAASVKKEDFVKYEAKVKRLCAFLQIFKPDLMDIEIDKKEDGEFVRCSLIMKYERYSVDAEFESTGIKKLLRLFDCFTNASNGGIVFIDELDSNINDVYFCKLIEYFMYYGSGQLIFTTHNLDPMNILKENKNSIDFLSSINSIHPWVSKGNATPESYYKNGMIEDIPFNVDATDFVGMFEEE